MNKRSWLIIVSASLAVSLFAAFFVRPQWCAGLVTLGEKLYNWNSFGEVFAAVFGAFFGSLSAFYLGVLQQRRQRREERHEALLAAQYAMQSQWNVLEGIRRQLLEKMRSDPLRHTKLPIFEMADTATEVPFPKLIFLARNYDPNLLQELRIAESAYHSSITALSSRNLRCEQFHKSPNTVRRSFDRDTGDATIEADAIEVFLLKQSTDALYHQIDRSKPRLIGAFRELQKCIKRVFGKRFRALQMVPFEPSDRLSPE
jgi:hypothetical protein